MSGFSKSVVFLLLGAAWLASGQDLSQPTPNQVQPVAASGVSLPEALDNTGLGWTTGGDQPWAGQWIVSHDGSDAAQSGTLIQGQQSWLMTTVTGPGSLDFWWKIYSLSALDCLEFRADEVRLDSLLGNSGWQHARCYLPPGNQTLKWIYKRIGLAPDPVKAWVDQVRFISTERDKVAPIIIIGPLSQSAIISDAVLLTVDVIGTPPLTYQWQFNGTNLIGATNSSLWLDPLSLDLSGVYIVAVSNALGTSISEPATLTVMPVWIEFSQTNLTVGEWEDAITIGFRKSGAITESVYVYLAISGTAVPGQDYAALPVTVGLGSSQTNRNIPLKVFDNGAADGDRTIVLSITNTYPLVLLGTNRNGMARLNADDSLDLSFIPGMRVAGQIAVMTEQPDGKIVLASFVGQSSRSNKVVRFNTDGSVDGSFNVALHYDETVNSIAVQADGKLVLGGMFLNRSFTSYSSPKIGVIRLHPDGSRDLSYYPGIKTSVARVLARQYDGKVMASDMYYASGGWIARLETNGSLDPTFSTGPFGSFSSNKEILTGAIQADDRILVGGDFTLFGSASRNRMARLNTDGRLDPSFLPSFDGPVRSIVQQLDGKIVVGGDFTKANGAPRAGLARLQSDGSLDTDLNPGTGSNGKILCVSALPSGSILFGGDFTQFEGAPHYRFARIRTADIETVDWIELGGSSYRADPGETHAAVMLRRTGSGIGEVAVDYRTVDGTAKAGQDYLSQPRTIRFAEGEIGNKLIAIPLLTESPRWLERAFELHLSRATGARLNVHRAATTVVLPYQGPTLPISLLGWNRDVVAENDGSPFAQISELGSPLGVALFEAGLNGNPNGLPSNRRFWGASKTNILIELQPYDQNNALYPLSPKGVATTLSLVTPKRYRQLILVASAPQATVAQVILNFADSTNRPAIDFNVPHQSRLPGGTNLMAIVGLGYVKIPSKPLATNYTYLPMGPSGVGVGMAKIDLAAQGFDRYTLSSLTFSKGDCVIFAASGEPLGGTALPYLLANPISQRAVVEDRVTMSVAALGEQPLVYQWLFNGVALAGQTNSSLVLPHVQPSDQGAYLAIVSGRDGSPSIFSEVATLTLTRPPEPLRIADWKIGTNGVFSLFLRQNDAADCVIQASENLRDWQVIYTNDPGNGLFEFIDSESLNYPQRFYRVLRQP